MFDAELNEQRINGSDLDAIAAAKVAHSRSLNVVFSGRLKEPKSSEPFDELDSCFGGSKALEEFLQHKSGCENLICSAECMLKRPDLWCLGYGVASEGEGPDACVYK